MFSSKSLSPLSAANGLPAVAVIPTTDAASTPFDNHGEANGPAVAEASFAIGAWSVIRSRKQHAGAPYKDLVSGTPFVAGLAGHAARRLDEATANPSLVLDQGARDGFVAVSK